MRTIDISIADYEDYLIRRRRLVKELLQLPDDWETFDDDYDLYRIEDELDGFMMNDDELTPSLYRYVDALIDPGDFISDPEQALNDAVKAYFDTVEGSPESSTALDTVRFVAAMVLQ